jgi:hypothetical protein
MLGTWIGFATSEAWSQSIPLGLKYNTDAYKFRYSVSANNQHPAVLTSVDQLKSFDYPQSQFIEFDALGNLTANYPSIARAFAGRLSEQIILIPQRYAIVRGKSGLFATCVARVDSSATGSDTNIFEFTFIVAPQVSHIDVQALQIELQKHPEFQSYQIGFASALSSTSSILATSFSTQAVFAMGPIANSFAITLSVQGGSQAPSVADANLVIQRLCSGTGADLIGTLNLSIDPAMGDPIATSLDLSLLRTAGTDDLVSSVDPTTGIAVINQSPIDITIGGCSILQGGALTSLATPIDVASGATVSLPWPATLTPDATAQILVDAELKLTLPLPTSEVTKLINFVTVDVAATQIFVAIDATLVDFSQISTLDVVIVFQSAHDSPAAPFKLSSAVPIASASLSIPLVDAVYSLPSAVEVTVSFVDPATPSYSFVLQNDFMSEPTLTIHQQDIDANKPSPA